MDEQYLQHPTFGLLYRVCTLGEKRGLFATLYAQRMLFLVSELGPQSLQFEALNRPQARHLIEQWMRAQGRALTLDRETVERLKMFTMAL